jgi:uncharacterized damage-inducible protein DinB|tara:strand:- start:10434 stop:10874 length:441 start_codon:yes stop_codon:yes gene_type:complete
MKAFFIDIFEYHHHFNQKLAGILNTHTAQLEEKTLRLFSHTINAHQIWNARITGGNPLGVHEHHTMERCRRLDLQNLKDTLTILNDYDLSDPITYRNSSGKEFQNSIRDVLFHIANHATHHKGQIIAALRQGGVEPPVTDYIFFKR